MINVPFHKITEQKSMIDSTDIMHRFLHSHHAETCDRELEKINGPSQEGEDISISSSLSSYDNSAYSLSDSSMDGRAATTTCWAVVWKNQ